MDKRKKMAPCPNCEGEGFLTDAASVGLTTPCPVCVTEGVIAEEDAVKTSRGAVPKKGPIPPPPPPPNKG